ncbi:MAG: hypothetical protein C5B54_02465 [Acidobacteria bacterium]|nr:MAG: hypothetical protein C5B54_02465 [Acidobacteriota bacterium]
MPDAGGMDSGGVAPPPSGAPPGAAAGPPPGMGGPPGAGGAEQGPNSQVEQLLANMLRICETLKNASPLLASGMQKACNGLQEAHTSLRMGRNVTPAAPETSPPYGGA